MSSSDSQHEPDRQAPSPGAAEAAAAPPPPTDPAQQSLADALRISFRILSFIMIIVVAAYLLTGVKFVKPQQIAILKVFGKQVGTAGEGLTYNWPFPIGEIELVSTREQDLVIEDFWMHETAEDKTKTLLERRTSQQGLRPGWDGALLTGDRNLLHLRLVCTYSIREPVSYRKHIRDGDLKEMQRLKEAVRSAVCRAAIRDAALRTADGIQRTEKAAFQADVRKLAQAELNALLETPEAGREGVRISQVLVENPSWPLRAYPAFIAAQQASNEKDKRISAARAEGAELLNTACGPENVRKLVGDVLGGPKARAGTASGPAAASAPATTKPGSQAEPEDLIGRYADARRAARTEQAKAILKQIDEVLLGADTTGEASGLLEEARADRTGIAQDARRRAERFQKLVAEYRRAPQFLLVRHWARVLDEVLNAPTVEKFYLTFSRGKTIVRINSDPRVAKQIEREMLKKRKEETKEK